MSNFKQIGACGACGKGISNFQLYINGKCTQREMKIHSALIQSLSWRSALKSFAPISPNMVNIQPILEATRLAPSAFGVQPYHIHVVSDPELKTKLREVSYDQPQVDFVVFHGLYVYNIYH
jgi:hypothetical protein